MKYVENLNVLKSITTEQLYLNCSNTQSDHDIRWSKIIKKLKKICAGNLWFYCQPFPHLDIPVLPTTCSRIRRHFLVWSWCLLNRATVLRKTRKIRSFLILGWSLILGRSLSVTWPQIQKHIFWQLRILQKMRIFENKTEKCEIGKINAILSRIC